MFSPAPIKIPKIPNANQESPGFRPTQKNRRNELLTGKTAGERLINKTNKNSLGSPISSLGSPASGHISPVSGHVSPASSPNKLSKVSSEGTLPSPLRSFSNSNEEDKYTPFTNNESNGSPMNTKKGGKRNKTNAKKSHRRVNKSRKNNKRR